MNMNNEDNGREWCHFAHLKGFDRIINQQWRVPRQDKPDIYGSLPLPKAGESSCNIVILGRPGTGKSTLALEIAATLRTLSGDKLAPATVLYYSLEQSPETMIRRGSAFAHGPAPICVVGPDEPVDLVHAAKTLAHLKTEAEAKEPQDIRKAYEESLQRRARKSADSAAVTATDIAGDNNIILFPSLSPRRLEQTGDPDEARQDESSVFWRRFVEIRKLVDELTSPSASTILHPLRMLVIDSLNVFGDRPVTRYLLEQLFSFFEERELIGIFIAEDPEAAVSSTREEPYISPGISYLADMVIRLDWDTKEGYAFRRLEVVKSRHTRNAYGCQQMKMRPVGISVYPSLHNWHTFMQRNANDPATGKTSGLFAFNPFKHGVFAISDQEKQLGQRISLSHVVAGPRDTFKTEIGMSFALGASEITVKEEAGTFLIISFDLRSDFPGRTAGFTSTDLTQETYGGSAIILPDSKGKFNEVKRKEETIGYHLWLVPGYLLSEEVASFVYDILDKVKTITRVTILDISQLRMRHPVVARQVMEYGNLFSVLTEMFQRHQVDSMFVCSNEDKDSDKISQQLMNVAHTRIVTAKPSEGNTVPVSISGRFVKDNRCTGVLSRQEDNTIHFERT